MNFSINTNENERKVLVNERDAFIALFSPSTRERLKNNSGCVYVTVAPNYCSNERGGKALSKVNPSLRHIDIRDKDDKDKVLHKKGSVGRMDMITSMETKQNVRLHEMWHALVWQSEPEKKDGYYLSHGLVRFKLKLNENGEITFESKGRGFEEGMAEVCSVLALIKNKATIFDGIYDPKELEAADRFMDTGEIDLGVLPDYVQGYFKPWTDIARLFIKASRNDHPRQYKFSELMKYYEAGIDCELVENNKPHSTYLHSAVNSDTDFQDEYDEIARDYNLLSYEQIGGIIDRWYDRIMQFNGYLTIKQENEMRAIVDSISKYNEIKLMTEFTLGHITRERMDELVEDFGRTADIVRNSYQGYGHSNGNNSRSNYAFGTGRNAHSSRR